MEPKLGDIVFFREETYEVVGLSRMIYDKDCEGEPEWKITETLQEVAIALPGLGVAGVSFQKPCWVSPSELSQEKKQTTPHTEEKEG